MVSRAENPLRRTGRQAKARAYAYWEPEGDPSWSTSTLDKRQYLPQGAQAKG